jgi:hypothetical protein
MFWWSMMARSMTARWMYETKSGYAVKCDSVPCDGLAVWVGKFWNGFAICNIAGSSCCDVLGISWYDCCDRIDGLEKRKVLGELNDMCSHESRMMQDALLEKRQITGLVVRCAKCGVNHSALFIGMDGKCILCLQQEINVESPRLNSRAWQRIREMRV